MGRETEIAWCHSTFNPWVGCSKVSAACKNCYAENYALRFEGARVGGATWGVDGVRRRTSASNWSQVRRWNREAAASGEPWRVFCASLADVFEARDDLDPWRADLWRLIGETPALTWLLLTKRPRNVHMLVPPEWTAGSAERVVTCPGQRLRDGSYLPAQEGFRIGPPEWPAHVWIGISLEEQREAHRINTLELIPAPVRFVSCEPLLGPLDLGGRNIQWVIAGGESGPKARRTDPAWFDRLQAEAAGIKATYFFKQAGSALAAEWELDHTKGGDLDELPERWRVREVPR